MNEKEIMPLAVTVSLICIAMSTIALIAANYIYFFVPSRRGGVTLSEHALVSSLFLFFNDRLAFAEDVGFIF